MLVISPNSGGSTDHPGGLISANLFVNHNDGRRECISSLFDTLERSEPFRGHLAFEDQRINVSTSQKNLFDKLYVRELLSEKSSGAYLNARVNSQNLTFEDCKFPASKLKGASQLIWQTGIKYSDSIESEDAPRRRS